MTTAASESAVRQTVAPLLAAALPGGFKLASSRDFRWSSHYVYESADATAAGSKVLVKVIRPQDAQGRRQSGAAPAERAAAEFNALGVLEAVALASGDDRLTAIHPFGCRPEIGAVVMEFRPARDLRSLIREASRVTSSQGARSNIEDAATKAGKLLALVHEQTAASPEGDVTLHGDLYPDNIMVDQHGRVFLLDTGLDRVGSAAEDIAKFSVGADSLKERLLLGDTLIRPCVLRSVIDAFAAGYRACRAVSIEAVAAEMVVAGMQRRRELRAAASALRFPGASLVARRVDSSMHARLRTYVEEWSKTCR